MAPPLADRCLYRVVNMMEHESAMKSVRFQAPHPPKKKPLSCSRDKLNAIV